MDQRHADHSQNIQSNAQELQVFVSRPFLALFGILGTVCAAFLALCGWIATGWMERMERNVLEIRAVVDQRADLPYRTAALEKRTYQYDADIQDLKEWRWRTERKR